MPYPGALEWFDHDKALYKSTFTLPLPIINADCLVILSYIITIYCPLCQLCDTVTVILSWSIKCAVMNIANTNLQLHTVQQKTSVLEIILLK